MLSGGIDSTYLAHLFLTDGAKIRGVHVNYGQASFIRERAAINALTDKIHLPVEFIEVPRLGESFSGAIDGRLVQQIIKPPLLAGIGISAFWAASIGYDALALGFHQDDSRLWVQNNTDFNGLVERLQESVAKARKNEDAFKILMPLSNLSKKEIVTAGLQTGVAFEFTWSCLLGGAQPCGQCPGCLSRSEAFTAVGRPDPASALLPPAHGAG